MTGPVGWFRAVVVDAEDPEQLSARRWFGSRLSASRLPPVWDR